jgi:serine/threonine protein kinase
MAVVYRALDTKLQREVALKILRIEELAPGRLERIKERFRQEAEKTAALTHPNIVTVLDYGEYDDAPYLVMQYVPGGTLKQKLESIGRPMAYPEAARLLASIARALDAAHRMKLVHRDVKPANILITPEGEPMLSDFGVARVLESEKRITLDGFAIGTPEYMAPEQWESIELDGRVDEYALGVVFYEMITGKLPFTADTVPAIMMKAMKGEPAIPDSLSEEAKSVLRKSMGKKPEDRYSSLQEFAGELEHLGSQEAEALPVHETIKNIQVGKTYEEIMEGKSKKGFLRLWMVAVPIVLVAAGAGMWGYQRGQINQQPISTPEIASLPTEAQIAEIPIDPTEIPTTTQTAAPTEVVKVEDEIPEAFNLDEFGGLYIYDQIDTGDQPITSIAISPDGKYLAATTGNNDISLWDVSEKPAKFFRKLEGINGTIDQLNFSQDGKYLAGIINKKSIYF